jgi:hypothetical protein
VEECLVQKLPSLFNPEKVYDLPEDEITRIAAETEDVAAQRKEWTRRLDILEEGLRDLRSLDKHKTIVYGELP